MSRRKGAGQELASPDSDVAGTSCHRHGATDPATVRGVSELVFLELCATINVRSEPFDILAMGFLSRHRKRVQNCDMLKVDR